MIISPLTNTAKVLSELGLGQNEAVLYETLLQKKDATIPMLKQNTPFSRTMIYYVLNNLERLNLVEITKIGKKTVYNASAPEKLHDFIKNREHSFVNKKKLLGDIIGELTGVYRLSHNKPGVRFFEGADVSELIYDSLKAEKVIYTYSDPEGVEKFLKVENDQYIKKRIEKRIVKKIIALDTPFAREHYRGSASAFTEVRLIPPSLNPFKSAVQIYNSTVSYLTLTNGVKIGVIIEDPDIAQMNKSLFEYVWRTLPPFDSSFRQQPLRGSSFV
jgi:sugar-specific transcriptional regulator TrmB